mmetsp:Transcript_43478/g.98273  ORF Transcript_43478/g.98273 Transcript_43478/m.98273 type:complete len:111 (+) Transcript_43478:1525-1857(+)
MKSESRGFVLASDKAVGGGDLSSAERKFIVVAWLPKATVQAAIGAEVLDAALALQAAAAEPSDLDYLVSWGRAILTCAVLAILLTAPVGAVGIHALGPRWLSQTLPQTRT